jgi:hypothetical protein
LYYSLAKEKKMFMGFFWSWQKSIELIPNGLTVSRRRSRPAPVHIGRTVSLRKTIVALGGCGSNNYAKHFEINHVGNDITAAARFYQLFIDRPVAPALLQRIIVVARHIILFLFYLVYIINTLTILLK